MLAFILSRFTYHLLCTLLPHHHPVKRIYVGGTHYAIKKQEKNEAATAPAEEPFQKFMVAYQD